MRIGRWQDGRGIWERCDFVSRPDDVIVLRVGCTRKDSISCDLRLDEVPGKPLGDFKSVTVEHRETEAYFSGTYARLGGKSEPEGYHALMRVMSNGDGRETIDGCMRIREADEITLMMRVGYLERAADGNPEKLRDSMSLLETDYGRILERHAAVHGDMFRRVTFCFGTAGRETVHAEEILARTRKEGPDTELLEVLHAVGRYALICSSGEPGCNARSDGELLPIHRAHFERLEQKRPTALRMQGFISELTQGYRDGLTMFGNYPWTGGAGWLCSFFYGHYLYTGDITFLRNRVVPLLEQVALFYGDFLDGTEDDNGKYVFYLSISLENTPSEVPMGTVSDIVPNATSEVAICRQILTNLITGCRELRIHLEDIDRWESMIDKLPSYRINSDGALSEWIFPGITDNYNHRHNSHLYGVYPALEIDPVQSVSLAEAASIAIRKRLEAGRGSRSAYGLMHLS